MSHNTLSSFIGLAGFFVVFFKEIKFYLVGF